MIHKTIQDPIFNAKIHIIRGCTFEVVKKEMAPYGLDTDEVMPPEVDGAAMSFSRGFLLWTHDFDKFTLLHECMHIMHSVLSARCISLTEDTQEVYSYYIEWLYKTTLEVKNEKPRRNSCSNQL